MEQNPIHAIDLDALPPLFQGEPVSLAALLESREARAAHERALLAEYGAPVLVVLANMPGEIKDHAAARQVHAAAMAASEDLLRGFGVASLHQEVRQLPTGPEGYIAANIPAEDWKRYCCVLEEGHPYGRLFDLDIIGLDGVPLSRRGIGFPPRACLVCGGPAADCTSRAAHDIREVLAAIVRILSE